MGFITSFIKVNEFDLNRLPGFSPEMLSDRNTLIRRIMEYVAENFGDVPGLLKLEVENDTIIVRYSPSRFSRDDEVRFEHGVELLHHEQAEQASGIFSFLHDRYPGNSSLMYYLGLAYGAMGDYRTAAQFLKDSVTFSPFNPVYHAALSCCYARAGLTDKADFYSMEFLKKFSDTDQPPEHCSLFCKRKLQTQPSEEL